MPAIPGHTPAAGMEAPDQPIATFLAGAGIYQA